MEYDKLQLIENKAENLLSDLKEGNDASLYFNALIVLVVTFLLCLISLYIKSGEYSHLLIYLIILVCLLTLYNIRMSSAYKENALLKRYQSLKNGDDKLAYVSGLLKYLSSGMNVKLRRLKTVRLIYIIMFPIFLVLLQEILRDTSNLFLSFILAIVIGSSFWAVYFKNDIEELSYAQDDIDEMIRNIAL